MTSPEPGFGLYVHWPFCLSKCPYCDFNSHVRASIDHDRWRAALLRELDHYAAQTPGRTLTSIFFGGGTPSLMHPETVGAIVERAAQHWPFADKIEITLEANPTSVERAKFGDLARAGINRVSLGLQAFDDDALKFLGRTHSFAEGLAALDTAMASFRRVSFDLIYARPGQTQSAWESELGAALMFGTEHLSLYQLTIEPNTVFEGAHRRGELAMPDEDTTAALYEATQAMCETAGLPAYEISNHARPGAESRHNLTYWRYGDYVGIGPGAHGRVTRDGVKHATRQHRAPEAWLEAVERAGHATRNHDPLDATTRLSEMMLMGLRLREGIARERFVAETKKALEDLIDPRRLAMLVEGGLVAVDAAGLRATDAGRQRLDALTARLLG
ncbi:MAG: radical SAM family heme chaperone HemW [Dongiaceae bacterium]